MKMCDVDLNKVSPMMRHYISVKKDHPDVIIFYRLGDFYEVFFEDAIITSRELELTLTGRSAGLEERVPMCGVPHHAANLYVEKLVEKGYKVGICEQLEDAKNAKGIVERGLTGIITKGTIMNAESLNENDFNYIGNILDFNHAFALCYTDITTGIIYVSLISHSPSVLVSEIVSLGLKEVLVESGLDKSITSLLKNQFNISISISDEIKEIDEYKYIYSDIEDDRLTRTIKHLITYISDIKMTSLSHLQKAIIKENKNYLKMDIHTKRNLELIETLRLKQRQY